MALEVTRALVTVTVYIAVVASAAVTVYATGAVKLLGVVPLVCTAAPTLTLAPVVVNVATRVVTSVPNGTVTAMVFAGSFMIPLIGPPAIGAGTAPTAVNEYAVMALVAA
jgi:hypothetical protein